MGTLRCRISNSILNLWRHEAKGHLLPIAALSAVSGVATLASPALGQFPVVLVALSPRLPFLLIASGRTPIVPLLIVATVRLCLSDVHYFTLGRRFGPAALQWVPGSKRFGSWWERIPAAAPLLLVFLRPVGRHLALAGATPVSATAVGAADVASTAAYVVAVCALGSSLLG